MAKKLFLIWTLALLLGFSTGVVGQQDVELVLEEGVNGYEGTKDTTLYNESSKSNGAGDFIFAGLTKQGAERRGLIAFDLSDIPESATITSVSLQFIVSRTQPGSTVISVHRLNKDWGEGEQEAPNREGTGALAAEGDATWNENFRTDSSWDNPGGDFVETASAEATAAGPGSPILLEGENMVADVQVWVNGEADNFGWILIGDGTAKQFYASDSEFAGEAEKPRLIILYHTN